MGNAQQHVAASKGTDQVNGESSCVSVRNIITAFFGFGVLNGTARRHFVSSKNVES